MKRQEYKNLSCEVVIENLFLARHIYNLTSQGNVQLFNEALVSMNRPEYKIPSSGPQIRVRS